MQSATKIQPSTIEIQFLLTGTTPTGRAFEKRVNAPFKPDAKPIDLTNKRQQLEDTYTKKGYKVSCYTVSSDLKIAII